jgi:hypothetical protein
MSDGGRRASCAALPFASPDKNEPAVLRPDLHGTRRHIGGGAARDIRKDACERPAGDGGALEE